MLEEKDKTDGKTVKAGPTRIDDKIESYDKPILKQRVNILSNQVNGTKDYIK